MSEIPSREFWAKYRTHPQEAALAAAIVTGVLSKEEIPYELLKHLERLIGFYEEQLSK